MKRLLPALILVLISGLALGANTIIQGPNIFTGFINATSMAVGQISAHIVTGQMSMQGNKIVNVLDPVNAQDAATKAYVDGLVAQGGAGGGAGNSGPTNVGQISLFSYNDSFLSDIQYAVEGVIDGQKNVYFIARNGPWNPAGYTLGFYLKSFDKHTFSVKDSKLLDLGKVALYNGGIAFASGGEVAGKLYLFISEAGFTGNTFTITSKFFRYDPDSKTLSVLANLPEPSPSSANTDRPRNAVASDGTDIYGVVMTSNDTFSFYKYSISSNTWNLIASKTSSVHPGFFLSGPKSIQIVGNKIYWVFSAYDSPGLSSGCSLGSYDIGSKAYETNTFSCSPGGTPSNTEWLVLPQTNHVVIYQLTGGSSTILSFDKTTKNFTEANSKLLDGGYSSYIREAGSDGQYVYELLQGQSTDPTQLSGTSVRKRQIAPGLPIVGSVAIPFSNGIDTSGSTFSIDGNFYFTYMQPRPGVNDWFAGVGKYKN